MEQNLENKINTFDNSNKDEIQLGTEKKEGGSVQEESHAKNQNEIVANKPKKVVYEPLEKFINKAKKKELISLEDFYLFKKIKTTNEISPLMTFILQNAINKFNKKFDEVDSEFGDVDFGDFPGIKNKDKENNVSYFDSPNAYVLYASFSEKFIANFWANHQLLADLLGVNPDNTLMSTELHLANRTRSQSNSSNSQKKSTSSKNIKEIDNKNYYKLTLGASFEYNALNFLLFGIKEFKNFPRIVYYPIVEYKDYEEIDSVFLIKEMKDNLDTYYSNFKSIDITDITGERKHFNLRKNDLVFVECSFDFGKSNDKISDFFIKILQFIKLFINAKLIKNLDEYTIKPIFLYNNNINLSEKNIENIKKSVKVMKDTYRKIRR